ncbi:MAG: hypothetical protein WBB45_15840 [Cyclobacteriaceae bacterium]
MRKFTVVLSLFLLSLSFACSQEEKNEVLVKVAYKPNSSYNSTLKVESNSTMNFEGADAMIEQMKSMGMELPMVVDAVQTIEFTVDTESQTGDESYPVAIEYQKVSNEQKLSGKSMPGNPSPLEGMKVYGEIDQQGKMSMDSIGGSIDARMKQSILKAANSMMNSMEYPEKAVKIGESFTQEIPVSIPIPGAGPISMQIVSEYTLDRIEGSKAYFNLKMNMDEIEADIDAIGNGEGTAVYDMDISQMSSMDSNMDMEMTIMTEQFTMTSKSKTSTKADIELVSAD